MFASLCSFFARAISFHVPLSLRVLSRFARVRSLFLCVLSLCLWFVLASAQAQVQIDLRPLSSFSRGHKTQSCDSVIVAASSSNSCTVCISENVAKQVRRIAGRPPMALCGLSGKAEVVLPIVQCCTGGRWCHLWSGLV